MKYTTLFMARFRKTPVFQINDVQKFMHQYGSSKAYATIFISRMVKSARVYRLSGGFYTLYNEIETVGFQFYPFYYGLGYALTHYNLWKQQANPYVLTVKNVRRGTRNAFGLNYNIGKISKKMFFGYSYFKGRSFYYPVSDLEKTLIDCIYYNMPLEDYVYENAFKRSNQKKMSMYLKKCNTRTRLKYKKLHRMYARTA